jgi:uncharacterized lipoprotein NlpE involved in copper resistance
MIRVTLLSLLAVLAMGCNNDGNPDMEGTVTMKVTDAPVDDAEVRGVFVTVTEVRIDGRPTPLFLASRPLI